MNAIERLERLPSVLLPWYIEHQRDLPWRHDREPYHVWLSEIMLQQTRVEAVKGYYSRFLAALPDIGALAGCDDEVLHKLWEGLGYYSRVRNLKKAAQVVMETYHGQFPETYGEIRALPGIGDYTAGAICSICFDKPTPAVDGNVLRVLSRLEDDPTPIDRPARKKDVHDKLAQIYPQEAGAFTQALMELGATVCGPNRQPTCDLCPCRELCLGYAHGTAPALPKKTPKKTRRQEERTVFILYGDGRYALEKRQNKGLLAGLWQFPNVPGTLSAAEAVAWAQAQGLHPREIERIQEKKHIFTHIQWNMTGIFLEIESRTEDFFWFTAAEIEQKVTLPTAFRQFWEETEYV